MTGEVVAVVGGDGPVRVRAEVAVPIATARLAHVELAAPADAVMCGDGDLWLDLSVTPRLPNSRACFETGTGPRRFNQLGDVFMAPPGHRLRVRSDGGRQVSVHCLLKPEPLRRWFEEDFRWTDRLLEGALDISAPAVRGLLERLALELSEPGFAGSILVELIAAQLAIEIRRYSGSLDARPAEGGLAPWRLRRIDARLAEVRRAPTLAELADMVGMSVRQLTRAFRASRGCSIGAHVARARVATAQRLLLRGDTQKAIAHAMEFPSVSSFGTAFKRGTGLSPGRYREGVAGSPPAHA